MSAGEGTPDFVHLHLHSEYSLLDGAIRFDRLGDYLLESGMDAVAVTDHGSLYGAVQFFSRMEERGIHPVLGMEAYITPGSREDRTPGQRMYHLTLLVRDEKGYRNLSRLSSAGYLEGFYYKPRIDREILAEHSEGLMIGSACLQGEVARHLLRGRREKAREAVRFYQDLVGRENFFIELMDHGLQDEKRVIEPLVELARETGAMVAATNDAHYLRREDSAAHDALLCLQTGKTIDDENRMSFDTEEFYVKTPAEMQHLFSWIPESITNTVRIAERCEFRLEKGEFLLPEFPLPEGEEDMQAYLRREAFDGLEDRLGREPEAAERERLDHELGIIGDMGFPGYFLIVSELMRWARSRDIPVGPGRGSAAGCLVSYALDITDINPLTYDLSFERFLNPSRREMPDIDLDVCCERRGEIIDHIVEMYGRDSVCQLITFSRIRNRMVVRDMARIMGLSYEEGDELAKLVASAPEPDAPLPDVVSAVPELKSKADADSRVKRIFDFGHVLENLARHSGVHAAGVIIAPGDLRDYVPLCTSKDGITTQFEKKSAERIGLLKLDLLGLRNVTIIHRAERMVRRHHPDFRVADLSLDDRETLGLIGRGETSGVFQLESSGMREALRKIGVSSFDDVVAAVAIYRPGSMDMIDLYAENKRKVTSGRKIRDLHPDLVDLLRPTYGVVIYQEQVMGIASIFAGMSMAEADTLRRAMSKKDPEEMARMSERFLDCARKRGRAPAKAEEMVGLVEKFAGYGFNKSHAVSYAALAYWTAWLKVHHPAEFLAACLTSEIGRIDRITPLIEECDRMGVTLLPPSVNRSSVAFDVDGRGRIVYALSAIKNVGEGPAAAIVRAREEGEAFESLFDFCSRLEGGAVNRKVLESLIGAGAMDCLGGSRNAMLESLERAMSWGSRVRMHRDAGQMSLFTAGGGEEEAPQTEPRLEDVAGMPLERKYELERSLLGFYLSGHPLERFRDELEGFTTSGIQEAHLARGRVVTTGGMVLESRVIPTKRSGQMAFLLLEDMSGSGEVVVFNQTYARFGRILEPGSMVLMDGEVKQKRGKRRFSARMVYPLEEARRVLRAGVMIEVDGTDPRLDLLERVVGLLRRHPGDGPVIVRMSLSSGRPLKGRSRSLRVDPAEELVEGLRELLGEGAVSLFRGVPPRLG